VAQQLFLSHRVSLCCDVQAKFPPARTWDSPVRSHPVLPRRFSEYYCAATKTTLLDYPFASVEDGMKKIGVAVPFDPLPLLLFSHHHRRAYSSVAARTGPVRTDSSRVNYSDSSSLCVWRSSSQWLDLRTGLAVKAGVSCLLIHRVLSLNGPRSVSHSLPLTISAPTITPSLHLTTLFSPQNHPPRGPNDGLRLFELTPWAFAYIYLPLRFTGLLS
jgi:hypothetical protein